MTEFFTKIIHYYYCFSPGASLRLLATTAPFVTARKAAQITVGASLSSPSRGVFATLTLTALRVKTKRA
jgi:hypothetical protein